MITKNELALDALAQLKISGLTSKPAPEEITYAIRRMDSMVGGWQKSGICLSYNKSVGYNDIDLSQESGVEENEALAIILNLAKTLAPSYGQGFDQLALGEAKQAYDDLFSVELTMREPDTYLPVGQGNHIYGVRHYFNFQSEADTAPVNCSTIDMVVGQAGLASTDFELYLAEVDGDVISNYTIEDGEGVELLSDSISDSVIIMSIKAKLSGYGKLIVTVTTSSGRILPRAVNFNVKDV